jgi:hypothetical protein
MGTAVTSYRKQIKVGRGTFDLIMQSSQRLTQHAPDAISVSNGAPTGSESEVGVFASLHFGRHLRRQVQ